MNVFGVGAETLRLLRAFLADADKRQAIRTALEPAGGSPEAGGSFAASVPASAPHDPVAVPRRSAYSGLTPYSDAFLACGFRARAPRVNLVLPEFDPSAVFAGVQTAIESAAILGRLSGRAVRLVLLVPGVADELRRAERIAAAEAWLAEHHGSVRWTVLCREDLDAALFGLDDLWLATHWWTAHALDVAARSGRIADADVLYLVQDYEPGFVAWSTDSAIAESTYAAGFLHVVNSRPVARHLAARGHAVDEALVFAPSFDLDALRTAAAGRVKAGGRPTVFFYGRPSKPRNMFALGIAALRLTAERLAAQGRTADFVMAGEGGGDVDLGPAVLRDLGALRREDYFALLPSITVGLSLQASPHPSHPPFDLAVSGARVVVNDFDDARNGVHPRIRAVRAEPGALADALLAALDAAEALAAPGAVGGAGSDPDANANAANAFLPVEDGVLGDELGMVLERAWLRWAEGRRAQPTRARPTRERAVPGAAAGGPASVPVASAPEHPAAPRRWGIRIASPEGPAGDGWGDTAFATDLAAALTGSLAADGGEVRIDRRDGAGDGAGYDVTLTLRGLHRLRPDPATVRICWIISHPEQVTRDELEDYDLVFVASEQWAHELAARLAVEVRTLHQATSPDRFHPGPADPELASDALFVGRTRGVLRPIVRDAVATGRPLDVYGDGWEAFLDAPTLARVLRAQDLPVDRTAIAYRSARIVLNDHWEDMRERGFLSNRLFDAVASGARVVSDPIEGLERFGGAVRSYRDAEDLRRLLDDDAAWPDAAAMQAIAARIAAEDSFEARAATIVAAATAMGRIAAEGLPPQE